MPSALLNSLTYLDTPAESRRVWASNARFCVDSLLDLMLLDSANSRIRPPLHCRELHHGRSAKGGRVSLRRQLIHGASEVKQSLVEFVRCERLGRQRLVALCLQRCSVFLRKRLIRWRSTATSICRSEFFRRVKRPNLFSRLGVIGVFRKPGCAAMAVSPTSASVQARQLSSLF
jgi:hypothetical protein